MNTAPNQSKNVLNSDVEIKGNLKFTGELTFDGKMEGDIQTDGILQIGEGARVTGNITAQSVVARGKTNGNIIAKDKVELKGKSELTGDIQAAKLVIEEGVTFSGKIDVNPNRAALTSTSGRNNEPAKAPDLAKAGGR